MRCRAYCPGLLIACAAGSALAGPEWWHEAVFYEVFVRSFADSQTGPLAGDGVGDIRGLIDRLDYLNDGDPATDSDLGVTALWLMPVFESPSYHGYDVVDYKAIDQEYGDNAVFGELLDACHDRGIRVIVDMIPNHCSSQHHWFKEARDPDSLRHDWFVWADEPLTGPGAPNHTVWHDQAVGTTGQYYYGFFWHGMPDLNFREPGPTLAMYDAARFWIEAGVDGFRLDAVKHLIEDGVIFENTQETIDWLEGYNQHVHSVGDGIFTVGEVWAETEQVKRYVPDGMDSAFEFSTCFAIAEGINASDASPIRAALDESWDAYGGRQSTFIGNHDMDRVANRLGGDRARMACAATVLMTTPGVPFIYYGEEIGMQGAKPDPDIRTPMQWENDAATGGFTTGEPWRAVNADVAQVNVADQEIKADSLLAHYKRLIRLRQEHTALSVGEYEALDAGDPRVLAFVRSRAGERLLVLINVSGDPIAGGWGVDAGALGVAPGSELEELLNGATASAPLAADQDEWRPIDSLTPRTGYVVRLP